MIVPVLCCHVYRNSEQANSGDDNRRVAWVHLLLKKIPQVKNPESDPDGKGVERSGVSVVTFPRLIWILVQVEYDGNTREEEKQHNHPEIFLPLFSPLVLIEHTQ